MGVQTSNMNIKEDNISSPRKKQHKKSTKSPVKDESPNTTFDLQNMLKQMRIEMQQALTTYNTKFLSDTFCDKIAIVFNKNLQELKIDDTRVQAQ